MWLERQPCTSERLLVTSVVSAAKFQEPGGPCAKGYASLSIQGLWCPLPTSYQLLDKLWPASRKASHLKLMTGPDLPSDCWQPLEEYQDGTSTQQCLHLAAMVAHCDLGGGVVLAEEGVMDGPRGSKGWQAQRTMTVCQACCWGLYTHGLIYVPKGLTGTTVQQSRRGNYCHLNWSLSSAWDQKPAWPSPTQGPSTLRAHSLGPVGLGTSSTQSVFIKTYLDIGNNFLNSCSGNKSKNWQMTLRQIK
jgi:hypothetical protein